MKSLEATLHLALKEPADPAETPRPLPAEPES